MVTLSGAVVSDGLEDGRVVSGVGGQFNFVYMAHELEDGRSIIMVPATRNSGGKVTSNIVWNYGHPTIPRHLRDIVITEYGIADLRGASDAEIIERLLAITDSRFQGELIEHAVKAGKLPKSFELDEGAKHNTPEALAARFDRSGAMAALPHFPIGTDFSNAEAELAVALGALRKSTRTRLARYAIRGRRHVHDERLQPALERLDLDAPRGIRQRITRAIVAGALDETIVQAGRPVVGPAYGAALADD